MLESNKLIAEFMGWTVQRREFSVNKNPLTNEWLSDDKLLFHTSWDWLMPVVEKIGLLKDSSLTISYREDLIPMVTTYHKGGFVNTWGVVSKKPTGNRVTTMKEATYNSVVEFIKWFNENKAT
tara:strand:- start:28 stop:396 length:369 start_codon:yes stop_codon:yes gene_type:complete